jgi:hypothetical protein
VAEHLPGRAETTQVRGRQPGPMVLELSTPTMATVQPMVALVLEGGRLPGSLARGPQLLEMLLARAPALPHTEVVAEPVINGHLVPRHLPGERHPPQLPVQVAARDGDTHQALLQAHMTPPHLGQMWQHLLLVR